MAEPRDSARGAAAIRVEGLTKYYGPVVGVEDLSFQVETGEVYGFLGANGAGKTTTMRLLLDLLRPSRGSARVLGVDCHRDSRKARRLIGYLPGELPIYPDLTAAGYLKYLARIDDRPYSPAYLDELLARFDVSGLDLERRLRDQSHGMKQKIGIIQALMAQAFRDTVVALRRRGDTTVFLSSHVLAEVESTCERIGLVRGGRMVATESMEALKGKSARLVTIDFSVPVAAAVPVLTGISVRSRTEVQWVVEVAGPLGPLVRAIGTLPVRDVRIDPFRLEDYIARFYGMQVQ